MAYLRTVKTASGATAVQIVYLNRRGSWTRYHIESAHDEAELAPLKAIASSGPRPGSENSISGRMISARRAPPVSIVASRMAHLVDALCRAYDAVGLGDATGGN